VRVLISYTPVEKGKNETLRRTVHLPPDLGSFYSYCFLAIFDVRRGQKRLATFPEGHLAQIQEPILIRIEANLFETSIDTTV
jgi:hypothetical protein